MEKPCLICRRPALERFRHCAECLEAVTRELLERRGGVRFVPFRAEEAR